MIPALYVALLVFHQELLPTRLLLAIAAAQKGVPLPPSAKFYCCFWCSRRSRRPVRAHPASWAQPCPLSAVWYSARAAVSARFLSAPSVIIVAIAAVTGLTVPKLQSAALVLRFSLLAAGALGGIYGLVFGLALAVSHLCTLRSFSTPYLLNLIPRVAARTDDTWLRVSWRKMPRHRFLAREEDKP